MTTMMQTSLAFNFTENPTAKGTLRWMSPELLSGEQQPHTEMDSLRLGFAGDIWAWACIVWEVRSGTSMQPY